MLVLYSLIFGFILPVPHLNILNETIRNVYFHVPMWFTMMTLMGISMFYSILHLGGFKPIHDVKALESAKIGILFSMLGLVTGSLWAKYTWGTWWTNDTKLNGVAISLLIYLAYFILRGSFPDEQKRGRVSAIYNIFAFVMMIVFIMILPRMTVSLHPGNGGNPAFGKYDLDNTMRAVFYPAVVGWIIIGLWIFQINVRVEKIKHYLSYHEKI